MDAGQSLEKLKDGNRRYLEAKTGNGDISPQVRKETAENGQHPYAIVIACSDSRVIPEAVFSCGIGELFTIRVAGNVMDNHQLGSVEYAAGHLGVPLVVLLGHTQCGAVGAAISGHAEVYIRFITDEIGKAIGDEKDDYQASCLNVRHGVEILKDAFRSHTELSSLKAVGAIYDIATGKVEFLEEE